MEEIKVLWVIHAKYKYPLMKNIFRGINLICKKRESFFDLTIAWSPDPAHLLPTLPENKNCIGDPLGRKRPGMSLDILEKEITRDVFEMLSKNMSCIVIDFGTRGLIRRNDESDIFIKWNE